MAYLVNELLITLFDNFLENNLLYAPHLLHQRPKLSWLSNLLSGREKMELERKEDPPRQICQSSKSTIPRKVCLSQ